MEVTKQTFLSRDHLTFLLRLVAETYRNVFDTGPGGSKEMFRDVGKKVKVKKDEISNCRRYFFNR